MRHIIIDTETTGLDSTRDKIVEVGAVELFGYRPSGRVYHVYANPGIPVPAEAAAVHGLTDEFLARHPPLDPAPLLAFLADSPLVAHNAAFDAAFLRAIGVTNEFIDSLALARSRWPRSNNTLDALCKRYGISTTHRAKHGALLDAQLLAEVYVELVGRQQTLDLATIVKVAEAPTLALRPRTIAPRITAEELSAHKLLISNIPNAIWLRQ